MCCIFVHLLILKHSFDLNFEFDFKFTIDLKKNNYLLLIVANMWVGKMQMYRGLVITTVRTFNKTATSYQRIALLSIVPWCQGCKYVHCDQHNKTWRLGLLPWKYKVPKGIGHCERAIGISGRPWPIAVLSWPWNGLLCVIRIYLLYYLYHIELQSWWPSSNYTVDEITDKNYV